MSARRITARPGGIWSPAPPAPKDGRTRCGWRDGADIVALDICAPASGSVTLLRRPRPKISATVRAVEAEGRKVPAREVDIRDDAGWYDGVEQFAGSIVVANAALRLGQPLGTTDGGPPSGLT